MLGGQTPSLDLQFANLKNLNNVTTGTSPVTFTRASSGTFVGSNGLIQSAATNVPRFDHTPTTGVSLGLLIEEQRVNQLRWSEDSSQWMTPVNATLTQNATTAPDGTTTADQMLETTVNGLHSQEVTDHLFVAGTAYTYSVFVKSINGRNFEIGFPVGFSTSRFARFNLSTGVVQGTDSGVTARIIAFPNGWYRCIATSTCVTGGGARPANFINNAAFARSYTGDTSSGIFVWGIQLETASFDTSYIPTTNTTITRSADVASITGTNFSSWYQQNEGTVFFQAETSEATGNPYILAINDGTNSNRLEFRRVGASNNSSFLAQNAGVTIINTGVAGVWTANSVVRYAAAFSQSSACHALNGTLTGNVTPSGILPVVTQALIGNSAAGSAVNRPIRRITFWPVRLPNAVLQQITT